MEKTFVASSKQTKKKSKEKENNRTVGIIGLCLHPVDAVDGREKGKQCNGWNDRFLFMPSERENKIKSVLDDDTI